MHLLIPSASFSSPLSYFCNSLLSCIQYLVGQWDPNCILRSFLWVVLSRCLQGPSSFLVPHCEKLIGSWWRAGHWHLALTGSPAGGAQSHGGGSVAKPAQGGGPDVARLCSIEIQTKPQIRDHFLEMPQLESGTNPEPHNSWSPHARIYVPCRKLYLGVIDWFL